jgi:Fe-S cluster assembly protein SufB
MSTDFTLVESENFSIGLNEDIVRAFHKRRTTMDDRRLEAFRAWEQMVEPEWAMYIM